jgi:hypothetical protein
VQSRGFLLEHACCTCCLCSLLYLRHLFLGFENWHNICREREREREKSTHIAYETGMLNKNGYNESEGWSYILVYKEALRY